MLVLDRKLDSRILITTSDGPIIVKVLGIRRRRVKLGIDAPLEVGIQRDEIRKIKS